MIVKHASTVADLTYNEYVKRQLQEVEPAQVRAAALNFTASTHFKWRDQTWHTHPYPGFAILSMVNGNSLNLPLSAQLLTIQKNVLGDFDPGLFYFLPPQSFHQTVANTLSAERFQKYIAAPGLEAVYPDRIQQVFSAINLPAGSEPLRMKMIGLSIFGSAIGILGVLESEEDYQQITSFRKQFYQHPLLASFDVQMTRPFIGHITLAYAGREPSENERSKVIAAVNDFNLKLQKATVWFHISTAELRRYNHLAEFIRQDSFPVFEFNR